MIDSHTVLSTEAVVDKLFFLPQIVQIIQKFDACRKDNMDMTLQKIEIIGFFYYYASSETGSHVSQK